MSAFRDASLRWMIRATIQLAAVESVRQFKNRELPPGELRAKLSTGGEVSLGFESMYTLDHEAVRSGDDSLLETIVVGWPEQVNGQPVGRIRDGLTLGEVTAALRDEVYAVALLQYGQINRWWELTYDEHISCRHANSHGCPQHCMLIIDKFNAPRRRAKRKKQREPLLSKFRLPELFPERGVSIA